MSRTAMQEETLGLGLTIQFSPTPFDLLGYKSNRDVFLRITVHLCLDEADTAPTIAATISGKWVLRDHQAPLT